MATSFPVLVARDRDEDVARGRERVVGRDQGLVVGPAEVVVDPHHLAGRLHLGPEHGVDARQLVEREEHLLDRDVVEGALLVPEVGERPADHHLRRDLRERDPGRLGDERHGPRGPRVRLEDVDRIVLDRELEVDEPDHAEAEREPARVVADPVDHRDREGLGRDHAGRIARVDTGLLDVLHDPADQHVRAVTDRVHVELDRVLQERVDQHGVLLRDPDRLLHVGLELGVVVDDLHCPPAEDVAGPDQHRVPDLVRHAEGVLLGVGRGVRRARDFQVVEEHAEPVAVLGHVHRIRARAEDSDREAVLSISSWSGTARLTAFCPPNWTMTPS